MCKSYVPETFGAGIKFKMFSAVDLGLTGCQLVSTFLSDDFR
jgi:hypothetical protein